MPPADSFVYAGSPYSMRTGNPSYGLLNYDNVPWSFLVIFQAFHGLAVTLVYKCAAQPASHLLHARRLHAIFFHLSVEHAGRARTE